MSSLTYNTKISLLNKDVDAVSARAELYGYLLFSHGLSTGNIQMISGYPEIRARYLGLLVSCGVKNFRLSVQGKSQKKYICLINKPADLSVLQSYLSPADFSSPRRLDERLLLTEEGRKSFLRGAFMANAVLSYSEKSRCLEFKTSHAIFADDFYRFCDSCFDFTPGKSVRAGKYLIYFKSTSAICDFLVFIGCKETAFDLINTQITRSYRNQVNRQVNCDNANIQRSIDASEKQCAVIETLLKNNRITDENLKQIALLRLEFPEDTLASLGERCTPPLSKAGVAHRMNKILALAGKENV